MIEEKIQIQQEQQVQQVLYTQQEIQVQYDQEKPQEQQIQNEQQIQQIQEEQQDPVILEDKTRKKVQIQEEEEEEGFIRLVKQTKFDKFKSTLPIYQVQTEILDKLSKHQVIVITGGTGCGKSTQVPQIILRSYENGKTIKKPKILCTQPRRLAAKTLAKRVAIELDTSIGKGVGYQVGMDSHVSDKSQIIFVTTGIFLQKLIHDSERVFNEFTHIIIDEVHERDIDIDFCLIIVKNLLQKFLNIKLILMSATICTTKFSNYFSEGSIRLVNEVKYINQVETKFRMPEFEEEAEEKIEINIKSEYFEEEEYSEWGQAWKDMNKALRQTDEQKKIEKELAKKRENGEHFLVDNDTIAPVIAIKTPQKFTIETYYLDSIHEFFKEMDPIGYQDYQPLRFQETIYFQDSAKIQEDSLRALLDILKFINDRKIAYSKEGLGSILIFLPGYQEIMDIREEINQRFGENTFNLMLLHSTITLPKDFDDVRSKQRRIILSTNVCESSITVPDCKFVIDFCLTKEIAYNPKNLTEKLTLQYCSKASADQRKGRTGRTGPGSCFRLIPKSLFQNKLSEFSLCEMLRCPLEIIILRLKKLYQMADDNQNSVKIEKDVNENENQQKRWLNIKEMFCDPKKTLQTAIDPPGTKQIDNAIRNLQMLGAISYPTLTDLNTYITRLGQMMSDLPIDIFLTRFIMYCSILGCTYEGISIAAILSQRKNFFLHHFLRQSQIFFHSLYTFDNGNEDDLLTQLRIFQEWEKEFFNLIQANQNYNQHDLKRILRQFTLKPITQFERFYCSQRCIDPKNMREILNVQFELFIRLEDQFQYGSLKPLDLTKEQEILKIKSSFCAAFRQNILYLQREIKFDKKLKYLKDQGRNFKRTIMLESENIRFDGIILENKEKIRNKIANVVEAYFTQYIQIDELNQRTKLQINDIKEYFDKSKPYPPQNFQTDPNYPYRSQKFYFRKEQFLEMEAKSKSKYKREYVKTVDILNSQIIIEFLDFDNKQFVYTLKRLLHECELKKRRSKAQSLQINWQQFTENQEYDFIYLLEQNQPTIYYGYICKPTHLYKEVNCDQDSINYISVDQNLILTSYEIQEKDSNKRNSTRNISSIDQNKYVMWSQLLAMLFGVNVKLYHSINKTHFIKAKIDDRDYQFEYFVTEQDLKQINSIRQLIRKQVLDKSFIDSSIWRRILELDRSRQKILFNQDERWRPLFDLEMKDQIDIVQKPQQQRKKPRVNINPEQKVECNGYMDQIEILTEDIPGLPQQYDEEGIRIYSQVQQLYLTWKQALVTTIQRQNFFLRMGNYTQLCCDLCKDYIPVGKAFNSIPIYNDQLMQNYDQETKEWTSRLLMLLKVGNFGDYYCSTPSNQLIQEFLNDSRVQALFNRLQLPQESQLYQFIACSSGKHMIGFYPKTSKQGQALQSEITKFFILDQTLKLVYTNMEEQKYIIRKYNAEYIKQQEEQAIQLRRNTKYQLLCKCCYYESDGWFQGNEQEYAQHVRSDAHKKTFEELQLTIL